MGPRPLNHFGVLWVMMIDEVVEPPASLDGVLIRAIIIIINNKQTINYHHQSVNVYKSIPLFHHQSYGDIPFRI